MKDAFPTIVNDYVRTGLVKVDFRGLGVVTRASEPALRYTLAASRQKKLWQVAELFYENQSKFERARDRQGREAARQRRQGPQRARSSWPTSKTVSVKKQVAAHAAEATRRNVPGTPWFFVKIGTAAPKVVRPEAYDGESFSASPRRRARPVSDRLLRIALIVVSAAGIGVAAYLTYVHYQPTALICTTGGGCETVQDSKYAVLAGIPIAILGLAAWIAALVLDDLELGARPDADGGARARRARLRGLPRDPAALRDRRDLRLVHGERRRPGAALRRAGAAAAADGA